MAIMLVWVSTPLAATSLPTADLPGTQDSPLLGRYEGSIIVSYEHKDFDEFTMPLSALERVDGKRDSHNNIYFEPKQKKTVEGEHWRLVYLMPEGVSPLEVVRNYQEEMESKGGEIVYECKEMDCGGDPNRGSGGGGGDMSLSMVLRPDERIRDAAFSPGSCTQRERISNQRYTVGILSESGAHVSVLAYTVHPGHSCRAFEGRTVAAVDIIRPEKREQKMVTIQAEEMAGEITTTGSIALYGIYFDFNKADIRSESEPTLEQIARLLRDHPGMNLLVVGHTDNVGTFSFNMDLSQRRAGSVVSALVRRHGIAEDRLTPVGVSFACPVASNKSDEGRAKNRRVELVER
jgi:outer membrane protein OmpA-like peptidoglycan-associated protein